MDFIGSGRPRIGTAIPGPVDFLLYGNEMYQSNEMYDNLILISLFRSQLILISNFLSDLSFHFYYNYRLCE